MSKIIFLPDKTKLWSKLFRAGVVVLLSTFLASIWQFTYDPLQFFSQSIYIGLLIGLSIGQLLPLRQWYLRTYELAENELIIRQKKSETKVAYKDAKEVVVVRQKGQLKRATAKIGSQQIEVRDMEQTAAFIEALLAKVNPAVVIYSEESAYRLPRILFGLLFLTLYLFLTPLYGHEWAAFFLLVSLGLMGYSSWAGGEQTPALVRFEGGLIFLAVCAWGYGVWYYGWLGHPCGYTHQLLSPTSCVWSWEERVLVGFTADSQQLITGRGSWLQFEPLTGVHPAWRSQYTPVLGEITAGQSYSAGVWLNSQTEENSFLTKLSAPAGSSLAYPWEQLGRLKLVSPTGQWLVFTDEETEETVIVEGQHLTTHAHFSLSSSVAFSGDEQWVALLYEAEIQLKQLPSLELRHTFPLPAGSAQGCVALAPDQPWLAYVSHPAGGWVWNYETGQLVAELPAAGASQMACTAVFVPGRPLLLTSAEGNGQPALQSWQLPAGQPLRQLPLVAAGELRFSPNGRWLAIQAEEELFVLSLEELLQE